MDQIVLCHQDFKWKEFFEQLFQQPPKEPFTYTISVLERVDEKTLIQLLGSTLVNGVKQKYSKELADLIPTEIEEIQKYYHSIGYEVKYQIERKHQLISEVNLVVPVHYLNIDFIPYSQLYNRYNRPSFLI